MSATHVRCSTAAAAEPQEASVAPTKAAYQVLDKPLGSTRHIRIVAIGAGASGLNMIRTVRLNLTDYELVVYEKNTDVGGTWFENRYPGCRCDIPSHSYQFSWKPKHDWSNFHSPADEINAYLNQVCDDEGMREYIKTSHEVISAKWNERDGVWGLIVRNQHSKEFSDYAHFLVDGTGILNNWKWPAIEGLETFKGKLVHTARWPEDFEHSGKNIAVIGNGSTGVQVLPELQPEAKKLYHVVRTPTWALPSRIQAWRMMGKVPEVLSAVKMDENENFSPEIIERFKTDPEFYRSFVKEIEAEVNNNFPIVLTNGPVQAFARDNATKYMTAMLGGNKELCKALIPNYPLGSRRMTPGDTYLRALTKPNVEIRRGGIKRLVPSGIEFETGDVLNVDAIVCATGFETSFRPRFPLVGRNGNLQDIWSEEVPKAYMSCAVAGMPNYFSFLGPNGPIGHGSVFTLTEHIAKYITGVVQKCQTEGIKAIAPSQAAVDDYFEHISAFMPRTAWAQGPGSWFKRDGRPDGAVTALHPGSRLHFFHMLDHFRGEDWDYVYDNDRQNRFQYLGNGFSARELDPHADKTWYLGSLSSPSL
ncbi:hypothetical protein B0T26DRAFT_631405 [Lasiosphaeria miniovina]|uniref:Uncharacterized protein n=1 Tax=Lasiosphaeria miniovina TaxID=1954250 RepID=A0AA40BFY0_9PEZI|nr:uncharacterized protein B0T26DRAFT_631405 [Lasiosphaeria miniovina]KAK0733515.1 hypothetical protein B0T26DRAFT_631405 [Lasiosphaeria miniovina]